MAQAFEQIAFAKGYGKELNVYMMCLFLGVVGYLYVIALPNAKFDNLLLKQNKRMLALLQNSQSGSAANEFDDNEDEE